MQSYFQLQKTMLDRHLLAFGITPRVGYVLGILAFVGGISLVYFKTEYAPYFVALLAMMSCYKLSDIARNDFLKTCFDSKKYHQVRLIENKIIALPFVIALCVKGDWLVGLATACLAGLLAFIKINTINLPAIPTPFGRYPFEMAVGFRKSILGFLIAGILTLIAISVDNFNLGAFAFGLVGVLASGFYANAEMPYFVWIFSSKPQTFLLQKIGTGIVYTILLGLPIAVAMGWYFPDLIWVLLIIQMVVLILMVLITLAKYSVFPKGISLPETLIMIFSLILPPLLLFSLPYFYKKSIRQLSKILK